MAFLTAADRFFVAAMIRARPSGTRRRFLLAAFAGAGNAPTRGGACDALGRFVARDRDRPFEAQRPGDEHADVAPERVRGNQGFVRLSEALAAGGHGRAAFPAGGGLDRGRLATKCRVFLCP
jgi:hypothetical protein